MLNFYVKQGTIADEVPEKNSFEQRKWLEKHESFITQKRNQATISFENCFYNFPNNRVFGKRMKNFKNRRSAMPIKKDEEDKKIQWQSKLTIIGIHKSIEKRWLYF